MPADAPGGGAAPGWRRVSPAAVIDIIVTAIRKGVFQALPGLAVLFAASSSEDVRLMWVVQGLLALALVGVAWAVLSFLRFGYRLLEERVEVRKGVLHRQVIEVEFDRIQNVSLHEPFYLRPFGLAVIGIDTAGSDDREIRLPGVTLDEAQGLRERLVAEASDADGEATSSGQEDDGTQARAGRVLLSLTRRDVVMAGLTANFTLWLAVAVGTVFGSGDTAERTVTWLIRQFELREVVDALQQDGGDLFIALVATGFVLLILLVLPLISIIGALFLYDGYTLRLDGDRFRRSSGMFSRHDESLRRHKIQSVTWKQNAIALLLGRINLQLRQASAGKAAQAGMSVGGATQSAFPVPALRPGQAESLTALFLPGCRPTTARFTPVDGGRFVRVVSAWIIGPAGLVLFPLALWVDYRFALAWGLLALGVVLVARRCWRQTGWAVNGEHALLRKGFIGSTTSLFPLFKVQRVDVVQTPWLARRGLAHLNVHLASHSLSVPWMRFEDAVRFRDLALYSAESSDEAWF